MNNDIQYALDYHEETKHSELKLRMSHYLDWDNRPQPFKVYTDLPSIALPDDFALSAASALNCISGIPDLPAPSKAFDIRTLAGLLFFCGGITREMKFGPETYYMRAASATGALYPIELYVVCQEIEGLAAGVYHFCPGDFSLAELRRGDLRAALAAMAGGNADIATSPATLVFTSLAWRNAWKYRTRSYRHWFWDSGVMAANLLAVAFSEGLRSELVTGFVDSDVNNLLLLEPEKEAAIALAPLAEPSGKKDDMQPNPGPVPVAATPKYLRLSKSEEQYPEIWKLHEASSLGNVGEARKWNASRLGYNRPTNVVTEEKMQKAESFSLGETILRRGSSRSFAHSKIPKEKLLNILFASTKAVPLDILDRGQTSIDIYFVANAVEGLEPGKYFYDRLANSAKLLEAGNETTSRNESGYLCLGQRLFSDASAVMFLMTDLDQVLKVFGNRGYRACQLESGVIAGRIYLSAYAQGLGASGSTFYDDAVTESFCPHAKAKAAMIAVGVGIAAYKARPGSILPVRLTRSQLMAQYTSQ